jgi:hypothetical protein
LCFCLLRRLQGTRLRLATPHGWRRILLRMLHRLL